MTKRSRKCGCHGKIPCFRMQAWRDVQNATEESSISSQSNPSNNLSHHCQCIEMKEDRPSVQEQQRSRPPGTEASLSGAASHTLHRRQVCPEVRQEEAPRCESTPLEGLHRVACRRGGKNATAAMVLHRLNLASSPTPSGSYSTGQHSPQTLVVDKSSQPSKQNP